MVETERFCRSKKLFNIITRKDSIMKPTGEFNDILDDVKELHQRKNYQYASDENTLGNFERSGELCKKFYKNEGIAPLIQSMVFMSKQIDAVYHMVGNDKKNTIESLEDKFKDIIAYSALCIMLVRKYLNPYRKLNQIDEVLDEKCKCQK